MSLKVAPTLNLPGTALQLDPRRVRRGGRIAAQFDVDPRRVQPDAGGSRAQRRAAARQRRRGGGR
jgi:hypothetical protein